MSNDDPRIGPRDPYTPGGSAAIEYLRRDGVCVRAPSDVAAAQLPGCLWEMIYALAARHVFLQSTDHLSDGDLYRWLYEQWLPRPWPEFTGIGAGHRVVNPLEAGGAAENEIWLRFYADEEVRHCWRAYFPEDLVPAHEAPPHDRDRWLPGPGTGTGAGAGAGLASRASPAGVEDDGTFEEYAGDDPLVDSGLVELDDPLCLAAVDEAIRAERPGPGLASGFSVEGSEFAPGDWVDADDLQTEIPVDVDTTSWTTPYEELTRAGVVLPSPAALTDDELAAKLWELLHALACRGFFLLHTDHLIDRELYSLLWNENLWDPALLPGRSSSGAWFQDCLGRGRDEVCATWLRYYASDQERAEHARRFAGEILPPRAERPARRDRRLPKGPFGIS